MIGGWSHQMFMTFININLIYKGNMNSKITKGIFENLSHWIKSTHKHTHREDPLWKIKTANSKQQTIFMKLKFITINVMDRNEIEWPKEMVWIEEFFGANKN